MNTPLKAMLSSLPKSTATLIASLMLVSCASTSEPLKTDSPTKPLQAQSSHLNTQTTPSIATCEQTSEHQIALSDCLQNLMAGVDQQLELTEQKQFNQQQELADITGRDTSLKAFVQSKGAFKSYRHHQCMFVYETLMPGSGAAINFKKCYIELTLSQIEQLNRL